MPPLQRRTTMVALVVAALAATGILAVPVNSSGGGNVDRKTFIPNKKHVALPGQVIGVLVSDAQPVLSLEGRTGPANQLCLGYGIASYRWVYIPVEANPAIPWLDLPVGDKGEKKRFDNLSLASAATVKPLGIDAKYSLVEVEVNGGAGSPAGPSFAATKIRRLDGTKDYPLKVPDVVADLTRRYQDYAKENSRDIDAGMEKAAQAAIKAKKPTGPRERADLMFVTWLPESERLRVHFRSTITDGDYQYEGGIKIELAARPGSTSALLPQGLRHGTQFGIEFGMAYEVSKTGKVERTLALPIESFQREVKSPGVIPKKVGGR